MAMRETNIKEAHNRCADLLNTCDLTTDELIAVMGQLLIYSGQAITKKTIDVKDMNLDLLYREYYADNENNDRGLGLILNGASIMGTLDNKYIREEIANDQVSTVTKIPQKSSSTSGRPKSAKRGRGRPRKTKN